MERDQAIKKDNYQVFGYLSNYLNQAPDFIKKEDIDELVEVGVPEEYAFRTILASAFGLDIVDDQTDKLLFHNYFNQMIHQLKVNDYMNNPYYQKISIPSLKIGQSELKYEKYQAYEGFVFNDIIEQENGRQIPQVGFFSTEFEFPAILENGRIWMTITPNEIETMKEPVDRAFGNVLTFGLGLGYYPFMVSEKDNVEQVTIVESNQDVIDLFKTYILPQFTYRDKVNIIKADAFEYAEIQLAKQNYDYIFTDLWHDVSDGIDLYLKMKQYEKHSPTSIFSYWIEKTILCYL